MVKMGEVIDDSRDVTVGLTPLEVKPSILPALVTIGAGIALIII